MVGQLEKSSPPKNNRIYQVVDRVLEGKPDRIKAKVWDLVNKKSIDPNDEFLLLFIALDHLEVLIAEAPEEWQNTLSLYRQEISTLMGDYREFIRQNHEKLEAWSQNNLNVLEQIAKKVEVMETLAKSSQELSKSAAELLGICSDLSGKLGNSSSESGKSLVKLKELSSNFENAIDQLPKLPKEIATSLEGQIDLLTDKIMVKKDRGNWKNNLFPIIGATVSSICLLSVWTLNASFTSQVKTLKIGMENLALMYKESAPDSEIRQLQEQINALTLSSSTKSSYPHSQHQQTHLKSLFLEVYQACLDNPGVRECQKLLNK